MKQKPHEAEEFTGGNRFMKGCFMLAIIIVSIILLGIYSCSVQIEENNTSRVDTVYVVKKEPIDTTWTHYHKSSFNGNNQIFLMPSNKRRITIIGDSIRCEIINNKIECWRIDIRTGEWVKY